MRLWAEQDMKTIAFLARQLGTWDVDLLIADAIERELVHPIDLPDEMLTGLDSSFAHFLRTGELSPERKHEIEGKAISDALNEYRGGQ